MGATRILVREFIAALVLVGCSSPAQDVVAPPARPVAPRSSARPEIRTQLDGRAFPDGVLALTFDDGPDLDTPALARYQSSRKVSATFFVVGAWVEGVSSDPGEGELTYATGEEFFPVLGDLVALGHRVGNHTRNHVLLGKQPASVVRAQIADEQRAIDPYILDELRLFRAPGGDWSARAAEAAEALPELADLVGPVRWDVDRKDWEASLDCTSEHAAAECEPKGPGGALRVKPEVIAARYLASIHSKRHGIVLLHARVGHVGSSYALDLARALVPRLQAEGYVFAAPVLRFSPPRARVPEVGPDAAGTARPAVGLGDIDGDGRADLCTQSGSKIACRLARSGEDGSGLPTAFFDRSSVTLDAAAGSLYLADVNGDGRADPCLVEGGAINCAIIGPSGRAQRDERFSLPFGDAKEVHFADIDGDRHADVCALSQGVLRCAHNSGTHFDHPRHVLSGIESVAFGDIDGDGRADVCSSAAGGISCALSTGSAFAEPSTWSSEPPGTGLELGDLNGDGLADLCEEVAGAVRCALSNGHHFTRFTTWWQGPAMGFILADVTGDHRVDLCIPGATGLECGIAP